MKLLSFHSYIFSSYLAIHKNESMNNIPSPKKLKGYHNTSEWLHNPGTTVSYSGNYYNVLDLKLENINIEEIARSLSREARYLGHTGGSAGSHTNHYSVAQHSVRGSEALLLCGMVDEAFVFLHHDDGEAFISDVSAPLKHLLKDVLGPIEEEVDKKIAEKFGFQYPFPPIIKLVDSNLAQEEMSLLMSGKELAENFDYWSPEKAEKMYILQHKRLLEMLSYQKLDLV